MIGDDTGGPGAGWSPRPDTIRDAWSDTIDYVRDRAVDLLEPVFDWVERIVGASARNADRSTGTSGKRGPVRIHPSMSTAVASACLPGRNGAAGSSTSGDCAGHPGRSGTGRSPAGPETAPRHADVTVNLSGQTDKDVPRCPAYPHLSPRRPTLC